MVTNHRGFAGSTKGNRRNFEIFTPRRENVLGAVQVFAFALQCTSQIEASTSFPGNSRAFEILENFCSNSPPRAEKLLKCSIIGPLKVIKYPHPRENYQITVFNFTEVSIMLLKLCMRTWFNRQNPYMPRSTRRTTNR